LAVKGNQTFFFPGKPLEYAIKVSDKEDGEVGKGINSEDVAVSLNYIEGFDRTGVAQGHQTNSGFVAGKRLIELSDCKSCHQMNEKSVGPSFMDISKKYKDSWEPVAGILANKILKGGKGVWGEQAMNAHPQLTKSEAESMAEYILSLAKDKKPENRPLAATVNLSEHEKKQPGMYILSASYTDKGIPMVGALMASQTIALRSPILYATEADANREMMRARGNNPMQVANDNAYLRYNGIDLAGVSEITVYTKGYGVGGKIELRTGSPEGALLAETSFPKGDKKDVPLKLTAAAPAGKQDIFIVFRNPDAKGNFLGGVEKFEFK
jgi:cytochrome c